jgi:hypothetical protein
LENIPHHQDYPQTHQNIPTDNNDWRKYQLNQPDMNDLSDDNDWRQYQQNPPIVNEQAPDNDDWRKFQVGAPKSPLNQSNPHGNNNCFDEAARSRSVGRGGPDRSNHESSQHNHQGNPDWMTYQVGSSKIDKSERSGGKSINSGRKGKGKKMFGKAPEQLTVDERRAGKTVKEMPFTDQFGDFGLYTGQVDSDSRPHGKGSMKYDNGGESSIPFLFA